MEILRRLIESVDSGASCVLATVVTVRGSAPRGPGARLLLYADGSSEGTVGGGGVEAEVLAAARAMLAEGPDGRILEMPTTCGGAVSVMLERFGPKRRVLVVGAGHVGVALATACARAGFRVTVVSPGGSDRLAGVPGIETVATASPEMLAEWKDPERTQVIVATGDVGSDSAWAIAALARPFAGVGVLGSNTKATAIRRAAASAGIRPARVHTLRCPVGLDLGAVTPEEIAVSIVAELIRIGRTGEVPEAWRRGSRG